ncbi:TraX family protein [Niallia circulans]|uniref:TraX family protein n=1 Tax=Niallia circulans TaxID=1397 RepID=UPI001F3035FA|nr:TraX family protein [Niallia circulans]
MPRKIINSNTLKVIAIIAMFVDHTSIWLVAKGTTFDILLHTFGRLAAPIMGYLIAEGFFYTSNIKKYTMRLFLFAIISHFPFVMFLGITWWQGTSVIWGLLMGLLALILVKHKQLKVPYKFLGVFVCCILAWTADWNYILVLWIVFFGIFRGSMKKQLISFGIIGFLLYIIPGLLEIGYTAVFRFGILLFIPLIVFYNGKRGKKSPLIKWGFYVFYPLHLLILYILRYIIFN